MSYRICPKCGAYLDPCESCDCQDVGKPQTFVKREKRAAPVSEHRNGRAEKDNHHNSASILQIKQENCQDEICQLCFRI